MDEIKNTIIKCEANSILKAIGNNINLMVHNDTEQIHWILFVYQKCGMNVLHQMADFLQKRIDDFFVAPEGEKISLIWYLYSIKEIELLKYFISLGANITLDEGLSLLHWLSADNQKELLETANLNKIDLDKRDTSGDMPDRTALHWAAQEGAIDSARILLSNHADIEAKDIDGKTPLHQAVTEDDKDMVKLLLKNGANKNVRDLSGYYPYDYARKFYPEDKEMAQLIEV